MTDVSPEEEYEAGMTKEELLVEVAMILSRSYSPSGDESMGETAEEQFANEKKLERIYHECKKQYGLANVTTISVFAQVFDVWIGLYRLDKCDVELSQLIPAVQQDEELRKKFDFKLTQSLAFTRWKQSRFKEAIALFRKMEAKMIDDGFGESAALMENMAHTFNAMGDHANAMKYFEKCIELQSSNEGGVLLGLGILKDRMGRTDEGLEDCLKAYRWFRARFSDKGNESSLEAKSAMSISKMYATKKDFENSYFYADYAVENFRRTSGNDSPLVAAALKVKGDCLWALSTRREDARAAFLEAFSIEANKDSIDILTLIELDHRLIDTVTAALPLEPGNKPVMDRTLFPPMLVVALQACENAKRRLPADGNLGAFYKIISELAIYANELTTARTLLSDAIQLFKVEKTMDCTQLITQCSQLIMLIDSTMK